MMTWQLVMLAFPLSLSHFLSLSLSLSVNVGESMMNEFTACEGGSRNHMTKTPPSLESQEDETCTCYQTNVLENNSDCG